MGVLVLCEDSDASLGEGWFLELEKIEGRWLLGLAMMFTLYRTGHYRDLSKQGLGIYLSTEH